MRCLIGMHGAQSYRVHFLFRTHFIPCANFQSVNLIYISVQQTVAELVTPPSKGDSDGLAFEGSAKSSDDWKTAGPGDVASKDSSPGSIHQSTETGSNCM